MINVALGSCESRRVRSTRDDLSHSSLEEGYWSRGGPDRHFKACPRKDNFFRSSSAMLPLQKLELFVKSGRRFNYLLNVCSVLHEPWNNDLRQSALGV